MGCSVSKWSGEGNAAAAVVSICRERKRLMKSAIGRQHALAIAHRKYTQSLYSVAMAIRLFVERHSSPPPSPFPIIQDFSHSPQLERETTKVKEEEEEEDSDEEEDREICEHFYDDEGIPLVPKTSEYYEFGWDFFNPFDVVRTEVVNGYCKISDGHGERNSKREREVVQGNDKNLKAGGGGEGGTTVGDANESQGDAGKELFEALKEVEEQFVKSCECGVDASRMLETSMVHHLHSGSEKFQESPNKNFESVAWGRSTSSSSSSCKSFFAFSSPSTWTWTETKNDHFDEYGGMASGSHSLTLGRLYAWEYKLYQEVKAGDHVRKVYRQKCLQLKNQDARCKGLSSPDKTKAEVRDLYSRILVAIRRIESISQRIEKMIDEELQPQLVEFLNGLMKTWKIMLESHKTQKQAISAVNVFTCPAYGKFCNDSHRLSTLQLEAELQNWRACFADYVSAQKAYAEALNSWLTKCSSPKAEMCHRGKFSVLPSQIEEPLSFSISHGWLNSLKKLPEESVKYAIKSFGKDVRGIWVQQGEEQQQKRKVDGLAKELARRVNAFQREEGKKTDTKLSDWKTEGNVKNRVEYLTEGKHVLDMLRKRLDTEKAKHQYSMEQAQQITLHGFQAGLSSIFDSLIEFSNASLKMYADLVPNIKNSKVHYKGF